MIIVSEMGVASMLDHMHSPIDQFLRTITALPFLWFACFFFFFYVHLQMLHERAFPLVPVKDTYS